MLDFLLSERIESHRNCHGAVSGPPHVVRRKQVTTFMNSQWRLVNAEVDHSTKVFWTSVKGAVSSYLLSPKLCPHRERTAEVSYDVA